MLSVASPPAPRHAPPAPSPPPSASSDGDPTILVTGYSVHEENFEYTPNLVELAAE